MTSQDGAHSGFRNVVSKFTSHTVQKPRNQKKKQHSFHDENLKSRTKCGLLAVKCLMKVPVRNIQFCFTSCVAQYVNYRCMWKQYARVFCLFCFCPERNLFLGDFSHVCVLLSESTRRCCASCVLRLQNGSCIRRFVSVSNWVEPRGIVRPEELGQWKISKALSGIEPATFWLVVQSINPLRYRLLRLGIAVDQTVTL